MAGRWPEHAQAGRTQAGELHRPPPRVPGLRAARPAAAITVSGAPSWHPALRQPLTHMVGALQTRAGLANKWSSSLQRRKHDSG